VVDGVGGEPGLVPVEEESEETAYDAGEDRAGAERVTVSEIVIECPVLVELVGDGLAPDVYGAIVEDLLGQVARVLRDA
jgi:hypothetical protein